MKLLNTYKNIFSRETFFMSKEIYCDWASTALFDTEILEKAFKTSIEFAGNPSSVHQKGIDAKNILQNARKRSAKALGVKEENIILNILDSKLLKNLRCSKFEIKLKKKQKNKTTLN